jgi:hypothetical protein
MAVPAEKKLEPRREAQSRRFMVKMSILCLSFANLSFLSVWGDLLSRDHDFFRKYSVTWQQLAAVTLDVVLLATVVWIPVCLVAKSGNRIWIRVLKWCVLAGLMLPFNNLRFTREAATLSSLPVMQATPVRILLAVLGVMAGIALLWRWERLSTPVTTAILLTLGPSLPLVVASVAWDIYTGPPAGHWPNKPPAVALLQKAGAPHVLWLIFDEWDAALTFRRRPANLQLPEVDRFRDQSFHADRAYPPNHETIVSVPSLVTGKTFIAADPSGSSELLLTYDPHQPPERLTAEPSIFSEARSGGFNVGITGYYLPYCRMFETTSCEWHTTIGFLPVEWEFRFSVWRFMVLAGKRQVSMVPIARRLGIVRALGGDAVVQPAQHAVTYRQLHEEALDSIVDSRLNLVFVHLSVPHPPAIYDAAKDDFSNGPANTYMDNLRLVDRTVRDIRLTLEKAGLWDRDRKSVV